jgi:hypothetical protein
MTPVLQFTREEMGCEVATLGAVRVGEVMRFAGRGKQQAAYAVWLPDVPTRFVPAESMFIARSAIVRVVEDWLMRIGVFYPGQGVEMRVPEDDEREARRA